MADRVEIRDGKEYRVTVLPSAIPPPGRSQTSRYHLNEVGKQAKDRPAAKPRRAGYIPKQQDGDTSRFHLTKFPFRAWINGEPVTVWPDWIEAEEDDDTA